MIKSLKLLALACILSATAFAQTAVKKTTPNGWHLEDLATTGYNGISLEKAYTFLQSTNRKSNQIVVAVIDSGIDTLHEDLKPILWRNCPRSFLFLRSSLPIWRTISPLTGAGQVRHTLNASAAMFIVLS